jgi:IS1 family transposase
MNRLPISKQVQIISMLVEGNSLRATSRVCDVSFNTVIKLLIDVGRACQKFHDEKVRGLQTKRVQCDEIWSFVYAKQKNVPEGMKGKAGDVWTWTGMDADSKLIVSWLVGNRSAETACAFTQDLSDRLANRVQMTSDGLRLYVDAVDEVFGTAIDFAQLVKIYGSEGGGNGRYSPPECIGAIKTPITGSPDAAHISTSFVERQNLTMRMSMRRFTRLTNGFSKKVENHGYAIALHFVHYNFCRQHKTLRTTPAGAAGLYDGIMSIEDLVNLTTKYPA